MKVHIFSEGDMEVGIAPINTTIEMGFNPFGNEEVREHWREEFKKLFSELHDQGEAHILFDDECEMCGDIKSKGECPNCVMFQM